MLSNIENQQKSFDVALVNERKRIKFKLGTQNITTKTVLFVKATKPDVSLNYLLAVLAYHLEGALGSYSLL